MIRVENLVKSYKNTPALAGVSFHIDAFETTCLFGPADAGKTMLLEILAGYLMCAPGTVYIDGLDISKNKRAARRQVGFLSDSTPLYEDMTVLDHLEFMCGLHSIKKKERDAHIDQALYRTQLYALSDEVIGSLPLSLRRRVALAGLITFEPKVLLLDQPFSKLRSEEMLDLSALLRELSASCTILFSSDSLPAITSLCKRVLIFNRGKLMADNKISDLLAFSGKRNRIKLRVKAPLAKIRDSFKNIPEIRDITLQPLSEDGQTDVFLDVSSDADIRLRIWGAASSFGLPVLEMRSINISLEEIFLQLSGHSQED